MDHEASKIHSDTIVMLVHRKNDLERIDIELQNQANEVKNFKCCILKKIIWFLKCVCGHSIALFKNEKIIGSQKKNGNYLGSYWVHLKIRWFS